MRRFTVVGVFQVGFAEFDTKLAMIGIPAAQALFRMGRRCPVSRCGCGYLSGVRRRRGHSGAAEVPVLHADLDGDEPQLLLGVAGRAHVMFVILTMIVLVAAFGSSVRW